MQNPISPLRSAVMAMGILALAGCQQASNQTGSGAAPGGATGGSGPGAGGAATAARMDADMSAVIQALGAIGARPLDSLTVEQARSQPSPADAVKRVMQDRGMSTAPRPVAQVRNLTFQGATGLLPARLYNATPAGSAANRSVAQPLIVYWHGGGWVIADLDTYDASARALAAQTGAMVLAVHYRQAPEDKFPAAHDDALAAYRWAINNARRLGADPARIAVVGESAGGNLAITTAIAARDAGLPAPVHMALIYPVAGTDTNTASYRENTNSVPLSRGAMLWFVDKVTRSPADLQDPRLNLVGRADLRGLPSTTIINAEIDPLRSDGEILAQRLRETGVQVEQRTYQGVTHEFFGMAPLVADATAAQNLVAERLRESFDRRRVPMAAR